MPIAAQQVLAIVIAASFAAGLNVYATVATLGLLGRFGVVALPSSLVLLQDYWVIGCAIALFALEFFADKVPALDLLWNALQTFVRVPVSALLAYAAAAHLSPLAQIATVLLASLITLVVHSAKISARVAVTPSPEPISNTTLSLTEDGAAIALSWFAVAHPYIAAALALAGLVAMLVMLRALWRGMVKLFRGARRQWREIFSTSPSSA